MVIGIIEGFHASPVSCQEESLPTAIPQRESKHAFQAVDHVLAEFLVEMHNHFGISLGGKLVSQRCRFPLQGLEVVDLAVIDYLDTAIFIPDRLMAGL